MISDQFINKSSISHSIYIISNSRCASVNIIVDASFACIDAEVATLTPGGAPLVLTDPVQTAIAIVLPTQELHGVCACNFCCEDFVNT